MSESEALVNFAVAKLGAARPKMRVGYT